MLNLTLWNSSETNQHTIELYDHAPVNLNYQFLDVTQINKSKGSYSQTFRIPATKVNRDFFGSIDKPNVEDSSDLINGNYNIKRKIRASLSYNSIPLMNGYVQIKAVYIQKKDFADIELIFFGETLDLAKSLQDNKIADLNTTSIDHTLNLTSVVTSWSGALGSGNVVYGLMDKGKNWSFADTGTPPWTSTEGMWQGDLTPYVKAKWLVDKIIDAAGFTYDSTLFDSADFGNIMLPAYNGSITPRSDDNSSETQVAAAGLQSTYATTTSYAILPLKDTVSGGYDYSSNWDNTAYTWTAPYTCRVTFTINTSFASGTTHFFYTQIWKNGLLPVLQVNGFGAFTFSVDLLVGDTLAVYGKNLTGTAIYDNGDVGQDNSTWFRIDNVSEALQGQDVDMSLNFPDIKQIDFLMGLQKMFNLVFVPDKNKPKHLIIEPYETYISTGTSKDWSSKIDFNKDVVITPTTDIQKNVYEWKNDAGQDFLNVAVQQSTGRVYGRYKVEDTENDFATGKTTIQTNFAPYIMSYIPESEIVIHRCIDGSGNGVQKPKAKLAYYNGLISSVTWYLKDDSAATTAASIMPNFSNYSASIPNVADNDLNFGYERAFFAMDSHPLNTMYYRYWMNYVNELYSADARLLTAYFKLTRADIQGFEFSDRIYINDTYYRILKISNYDATQGGVVKVDLIKILSDIPDCADTPTGQRTSGASVGAITFNNSSTDYGSQACCERYGYVWIPDKAGGDSRCYPTTFDRQPNI